MRATSPTDKTGGRPAGRTADGNGRPSGRPAGVDRKPAEGVSATAQRAYPIWILENSKPKQVMVTTGISDGSFTEITSGDVAEGQEVIVGLSSTTTSKTSNTPPRVPGGLLR